MSSAGAEGVSRGIPVWVGEADRAGLERWTGKGWEPADPSRHPGGYRELLGLFLEQVRNPFDLSPGCSLWFGADDLAETSLRPRHQGLDIGSRLRLAPDGRWTILTPGVRLRSVAPGGYLVGGRNFQKLAYILRQGRPRLRMILRLEYEHAQFAGRARGRLRCYPAADRSDYHKLPCAFSQAIQQDGRIVGYETFGWVKHPGGVIGTLEPGTFQTKDPELAARGVPKGVHLHLNVLGIHDGDPDAKRRFLNGPLREKLEQTG